MGKTLVAYFSKTGTTKEAAGEIGAVLREKGRSVDVMEAGAVGSLDGYSSVIFGAPINGMMWLPEASAWVEAHAAELKEKPHAYYLLSYMLNTGRPFWCKKIRQALDKPSTQTGAVAQGYFPGKIDSSLPALMRWMFGLKKALPLDLRDMDAVRTWAADLDSLLK